MAKPNLRNAVKVDHSKETDVRFWTYLAIVGEFQAVVSGQVVSGQVIHAIAGGLCLPLEEVVTLSETAVRGSRQSPYR